MTYKVANTFPQTQSWKQKEKRLMNNRVTHPILTMIANSFCLTCHSKEKIMQLLDKNMVCPLLNSCRVKPLLWGLTMVRNAHWWVLWEAVKFRWSQLPWLEICAFRKERSQKLCTPHLSILSSPLPLPPAPNCDGRTKSTPVTTVTLTSPNCELKSFFFI